MSKKLRIVSTVVTFVLMLTVTPGWYQDQAVAAVSRTITDQNGTVVKIPPVEEIERVVISAYPLPSIFYLLTGSVDKIVGIHPGAKSAAQTSILGAMAPGILDKSSDFVKVSDLNMEEMLRLNPDLVIWWGTYPNQIEQFESSVVPAVAVRTQKGGNAVETLQSWINLLATIFDLQERAEPIISHAYETMGNIRSKTWNIPDEEKPRILFLFRHTADQINVPGAGHYGKFWIEMTGGINVSDDIQGTADVNMEQIYKWNPDIIYVTNFTKTMPEDLLNNTIEGQDWSKVKAVQDGKVYKNPLGVYRWYPPNGDAALMMKWMAQKNYPKLFTYDMAEEVKKFYQDFYNFALSDEQTERILNAIPEAAVER